MRQLQIVDVGRVAVVEVPDPTPGPHDVVVRVHACGLCGSDLGAVARGGLAGPGEPMALGHEVSGTVAEVGSEVRGVAVGDRVAVHPGDDTLGRIGNGAPEGGLSELLLVRSAEGRLVPLPDDLDLTLGALVEPAAVGLHAVERLDLRAHDRAVVMGAGPIGLVAVAALTRAGVPCVAVDPVAERRDLAVSLGAQVALDPTERGLWRGISSALGTHPAAPHAPAATCYVEATGLGSVFTDIVNRSGPQSRISVPGVHLTDVPLSLLNVMMKELEIRGSMEYPDRFTDALDLVLDTDLSPLVTDVVDLDTAAELLMDPTRLRAAGKTVAVLEQSR